MENLDHGRDGLVIRGVGGQELKIQYEKKIIMR